LAQVRDREHQRGHRLIAARKQRHAALNTYITEHGGWLTSIPGDPLMRFEAVPDSTLPDDLRGKGYIVSPAGSTTRIDPNSPATVKQTEVYELARPMPAPPPAALVPDTN
jgi:hypothetical protein